MNTLVIYRAAGVILAIFLVRLAWRAVVFYRKRRAITTPLADGDALRAALAPRSGDDPDMLAELRDTILHLNRRAYAEEFIALPAQIVMLYGRVGERQRATLRPAVVRLIESGDNWLALLGTKTASALRLPEAKPALTALLASAPDASPLKSEIERALAAIDTEG